LQYVEVRVKKTDAQRESDERILERKDVREAVVRCADAEKEVMHAIWTTKLEID
jgi:hypothetical protein